MPKSTNRLIPENFNQLMRSNNKSEIKTAIAEMDRNIYSAERVPSYLTGDIKEAKQRRLLLRDRHEKLEREPSEVIGDTYQVA